MQVVVEQLLVVLRDALQQLMALFGGGAGEVARNVMDVEGRALTLFVIGDRLHLDQVDRPLELLGHHDRHVDRHRPGPQPFLHHGDDIVEIGPDAIHLVHERDARDVVLVGLAPHRLGLRLDTAHGAKHRDGPIEHAQAALDLGGEVDVSGRVDDVDPVIPPLAGGGGRSDRDAAFALLLHPVHRGGAFVHLADPVDPAGIKEDPLGQGGLAGVDMGHDPNVAIFVERSLPGHRRSYPLVVWDRDSTTCLSVSRKR